MLRPRSFLHTTTLGFLKRGTCLSIRLSALERQISGSRMYDFELQKHPTNGWPSRLTSSFTRERDVSHMVTSTTTNKRGRLEEVILCVLKNECTQVLTRRKYLRMPRTQRGISIKLMPCMNLHL